MPVVLSFGFCWSGLFGVDAGVCMCSVKCIFLRHYSLGDFFCIWVVFYRGFCSSLVIVWQPISPYLYFFYPPELVSASCTGSSVNKIWPFQKKKKKQRSWSRIQP
jgi:hypothetical protein